MLSIDEAIEQFKYDAECNRADLDLSYAEDNEQVAEWLEELKQLREQTTWIPCSERLPKKNDMYLCTQNNYDLATNKNIIKVSTELVEFYNGKWRRAKNLVITHWQPLPEPYKENN